MMNKTTLIFRHEFLQTIKRVGFIVMTLLVPLLVLLSIVIGKLVSNISKPPAMEMMTIGYVDMNGQFSHDFPQTYLKLIPFENKDDATQSLINNEVSEYFVIPSDYVSTGRINRYTLKKEVSTPPMTIAMIKNFLTSNLLEGKVSPDIVALIESPLKLQITRLDKSGTLATEQSGLGNIIIPCVFSMLLAFSLMFCANFLIQGFGEEKESRLIEVLLSSVSVKQLLTGKVLGLGAAGLVQVSVWLLSAPLLLHLTSSSFSGFIANIQMPSNFIILGIVYFILGYLLFAVLSVGVGAISPNARAGEQLALIYTLFGSFTPIWFVSLLFIFPESPIWAVLTIFPITAPVEAMLRMGATGIPVWELVTSIGVLVFSIIVGLFLAIRIFRTYLLMYGKRPSFGEIVYCLKD
jgi:ABC-2 type transport system permease protein